MNAGASARISHPRLWLAMWALALFTACLLLDTRHNTFPFFYHPDESGKTQQVLTGEWNFHHPMLLLTVTAAAVKIFHVTPEDQSVVETGRWISAAFTAVAVVAFSLLAFGWGGWIPAFGTGLALLLHHQLFELAHYMKEDAALLMGTALAFLTAFAFWQKPNPARALLLGLAVAFAISGKYAGAYVLGLALPVLWRATPHKRGAHLACFAGALIVALALVNLPLILHPGAFAWSLGHEMQSVVHGQRGTTRDVPHAQYWKIFRDNSTPAIWVLLAVFLVARWRARRGASLAEWLIIGFPFAYTLALSFSPKSNDRYFLPANAVFVLFAALGATDLAKACARWLPFRWTAAGLTLVLILAQIPKWLAYDAAFTRDDNAELLAWIKTQLPASAVIAKDSRIQLPEPAGKRELGRLGAIPQKVIAGKFAADAGPLEKLRAMGVTHVAVSETDYGRFFLRGLRPQKNEVENFQRRRAFYEELLRDGVPVFERERGTVLYLHPGIRVYELPPDVGADVRRL